MNKQIKVGTRYYDERNGRYLTTLSTGCDPKCWECEQEELNEDGEYEVTDHVLLMEGELKHMKEIV